MRRRVLISIAMVVLVAVSVGGTLLVTKTFSGDDAPVVRATATVDTQVEAVMQAILADQGAATQLLAAFAIATAPVTIKESDFIGLTNDAFAACDHATTPQSAGRSRSALVLWPAPYEKLHDEVGSACRMIKLLPDKRNDRTMWGAVALTNQESLTAARNSLTDYSPSQLRRAIADRR